MGDVSLPHHPRLMSPHRCARSTGVVLQGPDARLVAAPYRAHAAALAAARGCAAAAAVAAASRCAVHHSAPTVGCAPEAATAAEVLSTAPPQMPRGHRSVVLAREEAAHGTRPRPIRKLSRAQDPHATRRLAVTPS